MVITIFYFCAAVLLLYSLYTVWDARKFLHWVEEQGRKTLPGYAPPATLFCPCKGLDPDLEINLKALLEQDYPDYEVLFVVAEEGDAARAVCEKLAEQSRVPVRVVVAGLPEARGEKVNNLLAAVGAARPASEVFVFSDSDGRPHAKWIRMLVAHLADEKTGAASTFRWYIPDGGILSALQSAWNALTGAYFIWEGSRRFCWGGGTAIRRSTFVEIETPRYWSGCISDDLMLTRALRDAGREILFVPQCLVATHHSTTWRNFLSWGTRQVKLMRIFETPTWNAGLLLLMLYAGTFLFGLTVAAAHMAEAPWLAGIVLALLAMSSVCTIGKGFFWVRAAQRMAPAQAKELEQHRTGASVLLVLAHFLLAFNFFLSVLSRRFDWRGVVYEVRSPWETKILSRE